MYCVCVCGFFCFRLVLSIWNVIIIYTVCSGVSVIMCCALVVQGVNANHSLSDNVVHSLEFAKTVNCFFYKTMSLSLMRLSWLSPDAPFGLDVENVQKVLCSFVCFFLYFFNPKVFFKSFFRRFFLKFCLFCCWLKLKILCCQLINFRKFLIRFIWNER